MARVLDWASVCRVEMMVLLSDLQMQHLTRGGTLWSVQVSVSTRGREGGREGGRGREGEGEGERGEREREREREKGGRGSQWN